jgi:hypothetical protein
VFGSFLTARIGVSVGKLPQEVLLEESYTSECSETVRVGRVRVFEELPAVFNCSVLTFWSAIKFPREENPECVTILSSNVLNPLTANDHHTIATVTTQS